MIIRRSSHFRKSFQKRIKSNSKLTKRTKERIFLFNLNPKNELLRDHKLTGNKKNQRAFWITGDIRIVYIQISAGEVLFIDIGSHNQVY